MYIAGLRAPDVRRTDDGESSFTVDADEPFPLQYDGELHVETTPFTARILPGAIQFLTPVRKTELDT